uniref:PDZ domain-containing protein n=1 Tax=Panagrolaimus sp. PS1159 TaxID=55785 RepID=A0AC35FX38_9BILA
MGEINPQQQITSTTSLIRPSTTTTHSLHQQDPSITTSTISTISQLSQPIQQHPHPQQPSELGLIQREIKKIIIQRNSNSKGLGLTIAGGIESTPYIENDCGLFVSKLTADGSAELSGLKVGDKLIEVNGVNMINQRHDIAVQSMKKPTDIVTMPTDIVTMVIERQTHIPTSTTTTTTTSQAIGSSSQLPAHHQPSVIQPTTSSTYQTTTTVPSTPSIKALTSEIRSGASPSVSLLDTSMISNTNNNNVISTHISKDSNGSPGFSISQPDGIDTIITAIKPGGAADRDGKLRIG